MATSLPGNSGALAGAVLNGRWRLTRQLGEGGMGVVYEAEGLHGEGRRAIKLLHPEFIREPQIVQRFFTEAQATRALRHPNIAQMEDCATAEDGTPYLVMELLQGTPLAGYLDQGTPLPPSHAAAIVYGVLQALSMAHAQRIVHRDLKPDNLFLMRDVHGNMFVKVLDFGIAKVMDAAGGMGTKTRTGALLGTPGYMSPEQIKNSKGVDPRSDLWSVGVLFYEMLTCQPPFHAENDFARITAVLTEPLIPIERVAPQLAAWAPFFQRALAKDPAERFQSAEEMAHALASFSRASAPAPAPAAYARDAEPTRRPGSATPPTAVAGNLPSTTLASAHPFSPSQVPQSSASAPPQMTTHVSEQKPPGVPTLQSVPPRIDVVSAADRVRRGAAWWLVAVVGFVCLGVGFAIGFVVGGGV